MTTTTEYVKGTKREDGMIFWGYYKKQGTRERKEIWLLPDAFSARDAKVKQYTAEYHKKRYTAEARQAAKIHRDTPEVKAALKAKRDAPEVKALARARWLSDEMKQKERARRSTPEAKAKRKAYLATPKAQRLIALSRSKPENRARVNARQNSPEGRAYFNARCSTPEYKAKIKLVRETEAARLVLARYRASPEGQAAVMRSRQNYVPSEECKERRRQKQSHRYKTDLRFAMTLRLLKAIRREVAAGGSLVSKTKRASELAEFLAWVLTKKHGGALAGLDIDHLVPVCKWDAYGAEYDLNSPENLRWLDSRINRNVKKGNLPSSEEITAHLALVAKWRATL